MRLTMAQLTSDADDEHCAVLLGNGMLALLRREVGVHLHQLFGMDEVNLLGERRLQLGVHLIYHVFGAQHSCIDALYNLLEEVYVAVLLTDDTLPVPLVHIERVQVAQLLIGTDSVHVGIDAIALGDVVFS